MSPGSIPAALISAATWLVVAVVAVSPASAQIELWETEDTSANLSMNLQLMSAYVDLGAFEELPAIPVDGQLMEMPAEAGLGAAVGRLEWSASLGDSISLDIHNRLFWQTSTLPDEVLFQGFGVSEGDDRRLSTEYNLIDGEMARLTHDIDRLVLGLYFDLFDVYLGRQAIRWGVSDMFVVADRFAPLSPFELDTLQRRGIDAARLVTHFSTDWELDLVVADRGDAEPLSLGMRMEYFGVHVDAYGGVGRFWNRLSAMGGVSWLTGFWKMFGEGEMLWNLDDAGFDRPRATVGAQRAAMDWQIGAEYHYNGFGAAAGENYAASFQTPELGRGETYFLGRHYTGLNGFYFFETGLVVGGGAFANIVDPSVVVFPSIEYEIEQRFSVSAGAYVGFGEKVQFDEDAALAGDEAGGLLFPSEFGGVSDLYFVQMTAFF